MPNGTIVFKDCFPISLTTLNFDASVPDVNYFTAEVVMRYNYYNYFIYDAAEATDASMPPNYQVSEEVYGENHDLKYDLVITERRVLSFV